MKFCAQESQWPAWFPFRDLGLTRRVFRFPHRHSETTRRSACGRIARICKIPTPGSANCATESGTVGDAGAILLDSDLLIDALRGYQPSIEFLDSIGRSQEILVSSISHMELMCGCRNQNDLKRTVNFLNRFYEVVPGKAALSLATQLIRDHRLQHGISIPDAVIAATSLAEKLPLATRNAKHFRFIAGIELHPVA